MANIVLLMCGEKKNSYKTKARDLYVSERFQKSLKYAETLTEERNIFILSAKHGLVNLNAEIDPYDQPIYEEGTKDKEKWVNLVLNQLTLNTDIKRDRLIFLTGDDYSKELSQKVANPELPLTGMDSKGQMEWYNQKLGL